MWRIRMWRWKMPKPLARPACARCATWRVKFRTAGHKRMLALKMAKIVMPWERVVTGMPGVVSSPDRELCQPDKVWVGGQDRKLHFVGTATNFVVEYVARNCVAL